ncbi:type II toxin-antitoxin system HicB family antitoxin [bacterium]|nr:type II toxin-antitoxin system HicB family antitoxin [bacterium]
MPALPGYVLVGETLPEGERLIREAIAFHVDGLREDGEAVPPPTSLAEYAAAQRRARIQPGPR